MRSCVLLLIGLLCSVSTFAAGNEVCGIVKRISIVYRDNKIEFSDGRELAKVDIAMGAEAWIAASMANNIELCFKSDGRVYSVSSASK